MSKTSASRLTLVPPPILYVLAFIAGILIDKLVSWHPAWMHAFSWVGWLFLAVGIIFAPASAVTFLFRRTTLIPTARPTRLITGGVYKMSRNPMYLGLAAIYAGLAIVLGYAWPLIFLPIPLILMDRLVIPLEEAQSRSAFGDEYLIYCEKVRRWL